MRGKGGHHGEGSDLYGIRGIGGTLVGGVKRRDGSESKGGRVQEVQSVGVHTPRPLWTEGRVKGKEEKTIPPRIRGPFDL